VSTTPAESVDKSVYKHVSLLTMHRFAYGQMLTVIGSVEEGCHEATRQHQRGEGTTEQQTSAECP
jgi:hypothetical protein